MGLGDRRQRIRFEIEGSVWGALEYAEPLWVRNISRGGLLVESHLALAVGTTLKLRLAYGFTVAEARASVRRLEPIANADRYLLALEFVALDNDARELVTQMLGPAAVGPEWPEPRDERRRSPRHLLAGEGVVTRPVSMAVRLLDISSQGVLFACPDPLYPGAASRIVARLGGATIEAQVDVRHASARWDSRIGGHRTGGQFTWISPPGRQAIDELLGGGP